MTADLLGGREMVRVRVGQVALEVRVANHLGQVGARLGVTQERLRPEDDELRNAYQSAPNEATRERRTGLRKSRWIWRRRTWN